MTDIVKVRDILGNFMTELPQIYFFETTDSTNLRAAEYARTTEGRAPAVFMAREQSAGKGRRGRSFLSPEGGLYMSFLVYPEGATEDFAKITAYAAVALARAIERTVGAFAGIKGVNDLYIDGKKLAGILTEGVFNSEGNLTAVVCGMGINVYKTPDSATFSVEATSLCEHTDSVDINSLAANVISEFLAGYKRADADENLREYRKRSVVIGKQIYVSLTEASYAATAEKILDDYSLLIKKDDGSTERLFYGEVSLHLNCDKEKGS